MNSRSCVFLGILLAAVLASSSAVEVEQSKDVGKADDVAEPSYCRYRYCCRQGYYGCQRYCCRGSQSEADEKDWKAEEESKDVKPEVHKGRGGGGGGGYEESGETSEGDMKAGSVRGGKGGGKGGGMGGKGGGKGGGMGGKGGGKGKGGKGGGMGKGGKGGGKGGGGGGGRIGDEGMQEVEASP